MSERIRKTHKSADVMAQKQYVDVQLVEAEGPSGKTWTVRFRGRYYEEFQTSPIFTRFADADDEFYEHAVPDWEGFFDSK